MTAYASIDVPDCDCHHRADGWHGKLHRRRCPRFLAILLKYGLYDIYRERAGRKTLPPPPYASVDTRT